MIDNASIILDGFKHISKIHRAQFDERRKIEWKLVFTILAFYFGIITAKITAKKINGTELTSINVDLIWLIFAIIAIVSIFYLLFIHKANNINKSIAENAEKAITAIIKNANKIDFNFPVKKKKFIDKIIETFELGINWSWFFQSIFIVCMATGSAIIITL